MIERSFMGETLYLDEAFDGETTYIEDAYALVDGVFILASPVAQLEAAVEAIKEDGAVDSLARNAIYQRVADAGEPAALRFYCNLMEFFAPLKGVLENAQNAASGMAMMGVTPESLWNAMGLESMDAFWLDLNLIEDGAQLHGGLLYNKKQGFLKLLTYSNGPLPEADYVPEDAITSSVSRFSLSQLFAEIEALVHRLGVADPDEEIVQQHRLLVV